MYTLKQNIRFAQDSGFINNMTCPYHQICLHTRIDIVKSDWSSLVYSRLIVESCFFLFVCSLIHILICDIGFHFFHTIRLHFRGRSAVVTHRRRTAHVNTAAPFIFYVHPHTGGGRRRTAVLHFTPLSYFTASPRVKCHRKGAFFFSFFFSSAPETTIFLLTRRSTPLPMCARGGTCVIDAPRRCGGSVFCTLYLYKSSGNRLYIMIYWEKETICKIRHSAPPIAWMEWSCVLPTIWLWDWQSNQAP